jgi:transposase
VHRDTISVAVLRPDHDAPTVERIAHDDPSVRRLVARFPNPRRLRACYEAGPTGYELARLLDRLQVGCQVIAPTLIPTAPGDRVKTDSRDCRRLARLHRAGELVAIRIPTVAEEAVRDLCRARADLLADRTRARHRLSKFLLRHGRPWRGGATAWTHAHERWLVSQHFDDPALTATYGHYRAVLDARDAQLDAIEGDLATWLVRPPFADQVARLAAYRGVTRLGALTLASEVGDWRRFATAGQVMGFCGLTPSEYSSGTSTWRGHITKTGNATCAPSWWSPPGPTNTGPRPPWSCAAARLACPPRPSPGPGRRSCACAAGSAACTPARTPSSRWSSRSPASWPASCGRDGRLACPARCDHHRGRLRGDRGRHDAAGVPPPQGRSPTVLCHQVQPGAWLVRGTFLRTADLRSQPAYISLAGSRPTPRRRVMPTTRPAHHRRTGPASTIATITVVALKRVPSP